MRRECKVFACLMVGVVAVAIVEVVLLNTGVLIPQRLELQAIAVVVAVACALPGTILVLRRLSLLSDAISHVILLGIVLAYFVTRDLHSPWLIIGAALTGVATVFLVETLHRTRLVREDAAIGLVFPVMFSLAIILISRKAANIHLDTDAVLRGDLIMATLDRVALPGLPGTVPSGLVISSIILLVNVAFVTVFYKELKLATFDAALATALGFSPLLLHYGLMTLVSVTAVGAFDAVGSILVVAFMIGPPATAYLLSERLSWMLLLSAAFGATAALSGYWLAWLLDASIAGAMATMTGVQFMAALAATKVPRLSLSRG